MTAGGRWIAFASALILAACASTHVDVTSGAPGVVKGVASLPSDMQSALAASFQPAAAGGRLP